MKTTTKKHLDSLMSRYPQLLEQRFTILIAFERMLEANRNGNKIMTCGNGGSAADAEHIVSELMKGFLLKRPLNGVYSEINGALKKVLKQKNMPMEKADYITGKLQKVIETISLVSQTSINTAFANDVAPDLVFAQQVFGYGRKGDILIALSTSGNSENVINAVLVAKSLGIITIGFTGEIGGKLKELCDVAIRVPGDSAPDIQELHQPIYHTLCKMLEEEIFGDDDL